MENFLIFLLMLGGGMVAGVLPAIPDAIWLIRNGHRSGWIGPACIVAGLAISGSAWTVGDWLGYR